MQSNKAVDALLGIAIGDALGVPFEFKTREQMKKNPAKGMVGYGTHNQPAGTWSDDSSLTFCLAEALVEGYSLKISLKNSSYGKLEAIGQHEELFLI